MKKVVINLANREDRRQDIDLQLTKIGWAAEFFEATRPESENGFPSIGARGCFESHLTVLRMARGSDLVLMEDDLNLVPNFKPQWQAALSALPDDWSIFYPAHDLGESGLVSPGTPILCAHMVVFRASIIDRLITELETIISRPPGHPLGGPMHVDGAYNTIRAQNPDIKTYGLSAPLGYQRSSTSDISPHWIDAYPPLATVARKAKSLLKSRFGFLQ